MMKATLEAVTSIAGIPGAGPVPRWAGPRARALNRTAAVAIGAARHRTNHGPDAPDADALGWLSTGGVPGPAEAGGCAITPAALVDRRLAVGVGRCPGRRPGPGFAAARRRGGPRPARYLAALRRCRDEADHEALGERMPDLAAAHAIYRADPPTRRWALEARILSGEPSDGIAGKVGVRAAAIAAYERTSSTCWPTGPAGTTSRPRSSGCVGAGPRTSAWSGSGSDTTAGRRPSNVVLGTRRGAVANARPNDLRTATSATSCSRS